MPHSRTITVALLLLPAAFAGCVSPSVTKLVTGSRPAHRESTTLPFTDSTVALRPKSRFEDVLDPGSAS